ncbi:MAG TPA: thioredoxin domain-containing protein [Candidatus Margulisiibacteriota bacterium]|nr:thioredoxin domain-containing protein [Candidatus Margulisiibacteriota bacterium]
MSERVKRIVPAALIAMIGLGISAVIQVVHGRLAADVNYLSFCNVSASVNCDVVLSSRYASLAGLPVSTWAILYYLLTFGMLTGIVLANRATTLATLVLGAATWGLLFSFYMAMVAFFVLRTICLMCSALYLVSIGLFLAAWHLRRGLRLAGRREAAARAGQERWVFVSGVVAAVVLLGVGSWEALGRGATPTDAAEIKRRHPDFYRWYLSQPLAEVPLDASRNVRGSADAPVTIVEFSDFECGHCAAFHESLDAVLRRMGTSVRVEFRHFPLDNACNPKVAAPVHPSACLAAVAAECAAEQGKFWQYHNLLFANQRELGRELLIQHATRLGMDVARFTECLSSAAAQARVRDDAAEGARLGIDSTPTVFINGRKIKGALEAELLTNAVVLAKTSR